MKEYAPCSPGLIACICKLLSVITLSPVNACEFGVYLALYIFFLFCHSISSTFNLFYFHFKGSGGTDVVSNACLLPHCLKVRDDYFLMKPGKLTHTLVHEKITCKLWNRQAILSHHPEWEYPFISANHKSYFEVFFFFCQIMLLEFLLVNFMLSGIQCTNAFVKQCDFQRKSFPVFQWTV